MSSIGLPAPGQKFVPRASMGQVARQVVEVYESVTASGEKVREDARGQVVGRLARRGRRA